VSRRPRVALAVLVLPAGTAVVVAWAWLVAATASQSVLRQLMYWWSILVVPGALVVVPYLVLSRTVRRGVAALITGGWFAVCVALLVWMAERSLSQLTF
jgi:hypothetical protein